MAGVAVGGEDMEAVCLNHEGHERYEEFLLLRVLRVFVV
jgi:hypothetical protein